MSASREWVRPGSLREIGDFLEHWTALGGDLEAVESLRGGEGPVGSELTILGRSVDNRFATHPMEGWDADLDGRPTELTLRRWERFGRSGVALVWGGEAFAVEKPGRANPNQLFLTDDAGHGLERLRARLLDGAGEARGVSPTQAADRMVVGLQLTHSGRWSRPTPDGPAPLVPAESSLDARFDSVHVLTDGELERIGEAFVESAALAQKVGFDFVDVKCCHGYLLNELLGGHRPEGTYAGASGGRLFVERVIDAVRTECKGLGVGVRLSLGDSPAFTPGDGGVGQATRSGTPEDGLGFDMVSDPEGAWSDPGVALLGHLQSRGVELANISLGCPYTTPHLLRPAAYPPSDGYLPPEDPLVGVARHLRAVRRVRAGCPGLVLVGSGYSYLQEWLGHVAEAEIERGAVDFVGLGRMVLSYPTIARDLLEDRTLERKLVCRTFSDCTSAPRNHMVSGCYPLDSFYKQRPEAQRLRELKRAAAGSDT